MLRIVALCPNPAVDVSMETGSVHSHRKIRSEQQCIEPGGGGINVARALAEFGLRAQLVYLAGGPSGRLLEGALARSGLDGQRVAIAGDTRICVNVHERVSRAEYRFVPDGPRVDASEARAWEQALAVLPLAAPDIVVASGSLPRGLDIGTYARLAERVAGHGARLVLDTCGDALAAALAPGAAPPFLIKPSLGELESLTGERLDQGGAERAASRLVENGRAAHVAVSMGPHGALLASGDGVVRRLPSPRVRAHSAVGAGDSFLAAMVWRIALGDTIESAFGYGVAAGAAAVMTGGTELCRRADVMGLHAVLGPPLSVDPSAR